MAVIPMKALDHALGMICLVFKKVQEFNSSQKNVLHALANVTGNAFYRVSVVETLENRVTDRTKVLSLLYEISKSASNFTNREVTFTNALEKTLKAINCSLGTIDLFDPVVKSLTQAAMVDHNSHHFDNSILLTEHLDLASRVYAKQDVLVNLIPHNTHSKRKKNDLDADKVSFIGIPITFQSNKLGVLCLYRLNNPGWLDEEKDLLKAVAGQIAVVIENINLREKEDKSVLIEERTRLARELHDSVTQSLYSLSLFAEAGKQALSVDNHERLKQNLEMIADTSYQSLKEMRLLVYELRHPDLENIGLVGALRKRLDAIEQRIGIKVEVNAEGFVSLPDAVETGLYRIAQEVLNNVLKHAKANAVEINFRQSSKYLEMLISDNGIGFDLKNLDDLGGMGLPIMRERAQLIGAQFNIVSSRGHGTKVVIKVPLGPKEKGD
jgi:signal transduction histidine kinase